MLEFDLQAVGLLNEASVNSINVIILTQIELVSNISQKILCIRYLSDYYYYVISYDLAQSDHIKSIVLKWFLFYLECHRLCHAVVIEGHSHGEHVAEGPPFFEASVLVETLVKNVHQLDSIAGDFTDDVLPPFLLKGQFTVYVCNEVV
jgi:hypothetical protein